MKSYFASKTLWFNLAAFVLMLVQGSTTYVVLSPEVQGAIVILGNFFLRLVTKEGVALKA